MDEKDLKLKQLEETENEQLYGSMTDYLDYCEKLNSYDDSYSMGDELKTLHIKSSPFAGNPTSPLRTKSNLETFYMNATKVIYEGRQSNIYSLNEGEQLFLIPPPNQYNNVITIVTKDREEIGVVSDQHTLKILNNISKGYKYILTVDSFNRFPTGTGVKIKVECFIPVYDYETTVEEEKIIKSEIVSHFEQLRWVKHSEIVNDGYLIQLLVPIKYVSRNITSDEVYPIIIKKKFSSKIYTIVSALPVPVRSKDYIDTIIPKAQSIAEKTFVEKEYTLSPSYLEEDMGINFIYNANGIVKGLEKECLYQLVQGTTLFTHRYMELINIDSNISERDNIIKNDLVNLFKNLNCFESLENYSDGYEIKLATPISITGRNLSSSSKYSIIVRKRSSSHIYNVIASLPALRPSAKSIIENLATQIFTNKKYSIDFIPGSNNMGINFIYNVENLVTGKEIDSILDVVKDVTYLSYRFIRVLTGDDKDPSYSSSSTKSEGCYIATCVYGSYDCPQVWTLRRYRDNTLAKTWYGKMFIRTYYSISPTLVKWFGHTNWFKKLWVGTLNKMVENLQSNGVESTPYEDKRW